MLSLSMSDTPLHHPSTRRLRIRVGGYFSPQPAITKPIKCDHRVSRLLDFPLSRDRGFDDRSQDSREKRVFESIVPVLASAFQKPGFVLLDRFRPHDITSPHMAASSCPGLPGHRPAAAASASRRSPARSISETWTPAFASAASSAPSTCMPRRMTRIVEQAMRALRWLKFMIRPLSSPGPASPPDSGGSRT